MQRVLIVGISGAGKSTFARQLALRTGLPLIHLDQLFWQSGWVMTPLPVWRARVEGLASGERWIIDGNYNQSLAGRLARADTVVWFDRGRGSALWRVGRRVVTGYGRTRPDMAGGCPERFDWEFLRYVWSFNDTSRPRLADMLAQDGGHATIHLITTDAEARKVLLKLARNETV